mgnify:CR=1 FL=1|jgi:DNA-binding MurR/RpiR family transcriptional regulator
MGGKNIMKLIDEQYDNMTNSYKIIANFIKDSYQYITYDTLSELSSKIDVSTTTVIRFARSLGFDGYSELQDAIRRYSKDNDPYNMNYRLTSSYNPKETELELLNSTFNKDIENMVNTLNNLSYEDLKQTIELIVKARSVYVVGYNDSFILSSYMALRLGQIRENVILINQLGGMYPFEISSANKSDILIAYLYPRYSTHTINIINILKEKGLKIIIITSNNIMPIKNLGNIIIPTFVTGLNVKDSIVAPIFLSNFIANSVAYSDYDKALEYLKNAEKILSKGYYLTSR